MRGIPRRRRYQLSPDQSFDDGGTVAETMGEMPGRLVSLSKSNAVYGGLVKWVPWLQGAKSWEPLWSAPAQPPSPFSTALESGAKLGLDLRPVATLGSMAKRYLAVDVEGTAFISRPLGGFGDK